MGGIAVAFLAVGCGGSDGAPNGTADDSKREVECGAFKLTFEESYGFCDSGCISTMELSSDGTGSAARSEAHERPQTKRDFTLTEEELAAVRTGLETGTTITWERTYGCADCVDQGSYELTYKTCDGQRTTIVDPFEQPEELKPLIKTLRALLRANRP
ncbi:hypothetical protein [Myxococcus landrumensis]|uniref:Lipoprotein n=1 Tax=Myxococcus landrumensis TaxID=2813577 RepID=A0ABX7N5Z8_9BACT|nr:hypothetical protein [Myxococcus landrumus]QSQ13873.1 hypothetical protein JY572_37045 [Myxococcus landrumus]